MVRQSLFGAVIAAVASALATAASAQSFLSGVESNYSIGVMRGKAQEYVYNTNGSVLSRLDWTFDNVAMFNAHTSVRVLNGLRAGIHTSFNLSGNSTMNDYDFDVFGCPPTPGGGTFCASNHPSTELRRAHLFDVYAAVDLIKSNALTVQALAGYKRDQFRWQAIGGTANYGGLPPGVGITYEQTWSTPYIGLAIAATSGKFTFNGRLTGSFWAQGQDKDDHHLRALTFVDTFDKTRMLNAEIGLAYRLNSALSLTADYRYQTWGTGKGPTSIVDRETGAVGIIGGNAAGANAVSHLISLGLKVDLQQSMGGDAGLKDAPVASAAKFSGWSLGLSAGMQVQRDDWQTTRLTLPPSADLTEASTANARFGDKGQRAGIHLGHMWQTGNLVWGVEGDVGRSNTRAWMHGVLGSYIPGVLERSPDVVEVGSGWDASLRLRAGLQVTPALLAYATAGFAMQQVQASISCPETGYSWCIANPAYENLSKWKTGWTAGAGYELAFAGNWFTRGEYRYTAIGGVTHTFFAGTPIDAVTAKIEPSNHRLSFGLGYRF